MRLWVVVNVLNNLPNGSAPVVFLLVVAAGAIIIVQKIVRPGRLRRSLLSKADAVINRQTDQLVRRRAQLVRQDAYGKCRQCEPSIYQNDLPSRTELPQR